MMNHHIRSIDSEWEGDDVLIVDQEKVFRDYINHIFCKVINSGRIYQVKYKILFRLSRYFQGKTAICFEDRKQWGFYNFSGDDLEPDYDNDIPAIKITDHLGKCIHLKRLDNGEYISSYISSLSTINIEIHTKKRLSFYPNLGSQEYNFYLDLLSQYDEPSYSFD